MPEQKRKVDDEQRPVSFRASKETRRQLDDLIRRWGENQTQVITRAIQLAWAMETTGESR